MPGTHFSIRFFSELSPAYFRFETFYRFGERQFVCAGYLVPAGEELVDRLDGEGRTERVERVEHRCQLDMLYRLCCSA